MAFLPREYIERLFKVEAKTAVAGQKIIPFKLNPAQAELDASTILYKYHTILKARQLGISTYVTARFLAKCLSVEGTHAAVVSHEKQATIRLLRRAHFFLNMLKSDGVEVPTEYENKAEITFPVKHSSLYIGTAGQKSFSRGDMLTDFHASEIAFWPEPERIMTGVMGALTSDAEVFLESTANGMGGYFYNNCEKAQTDKEFQYKFHFYPWFLDLGYVAPVKESTIWSPYELYMARKYGLTGLQLAWRRKKRQDYQTEEEFLQEFPANPDEAFIVTGTCYFDKMSLRTYLRQCKDPDAIGTVEIIQGQARFIRVSSGNTKIWAMPRPMVDYIVSADAAEGIESPETDFSYANVLDRERLCQAAAIRGKIDPIEFAKQLYAIGKMYHWALIAVEDNGPGLSVLLALKEMGYPRLYRHRKTEEVDGISKEMVKLGFHTDMRTRPLILSEVRNAIKTQIYGIRDQVLIKECTTFCKQKDGSWKANSGCHDDSVIAHAIALYINKTIPYETPADFDRFGRVEPREVIQRGHKTGY